MSNFFEERMIETLDRQILLDALERELERLPRGKARGLRSYRQRLVLVLHYNGERPLAFREIAYLLGVSTERAQQLETQAKWRLRRAENLRQLS